MSHSCAMPCGTGDLGLPIFWYEIRTEPISSGYQLNIHENTIVSIKYTASSGTRNKHIKCEFIQTGLPSIPEAPVEASRRRIKAQLLLHLICWDWGPNPSIATNTGWFLPSLSASFSCHSPSHLHLLSTRHLHLRSPLLEIPSELSASSNGGGGWTWKCLFLAGKPSSPSPRVNADLSPQPTPWSCSLFLPQDLDTHCSLPETLFLLSDWKSSLHHDVLPKQHFE